MTLEGRTLKSRRNTWWDLETNQGHAWDGDPDPGLRCGPGVGYTPGTDGADSREPVDGGPNLESWEAETQPRVEHV